MQTLFIVLFKFFAAPLAPHELLDKTFLQHLKEAAHPKAYAKLEKAMTFNPVEYYQKKCVDRHMLLQEKIENDIEQKIANVGKKYLPNKSQQPDHAVTDNDQQIHFDLDGSITLAHPNDQASLEIKKAVEKYVKIVDVSASVFIEPNEKVPVMGVNARPVDEKYTFHLHFKPKSWELKHFLDCIITHELTHIKFNDIVDYAIFSHSKSAEAAKKMRYYQEVRADNYHASNSLEIAKQSESLYSTLLALNFWPVTINVFKLLPHTLSYNHPFKGVELKDDHPSHLLRYAKLMKTRKVLEAQKSWFKTTEADKRYGNAYYEIAFAKAHENKESLKRWKKIQFNSF